MNTFAKASLMAGLVLASFAAVAAPFQMNLSGESAEYGKHQGKIYYRVNGTVPDQYLAPDHAIVNYHHYHLEKPQDGYVWVRGEENDYLLVAKATHILRRIEFRPNIPPESESTK
jgi:Ni/Co efflux regulator RcnB